MLCVLLSTVGIVTRKSRLACDGVRFDPFRPSGQKLARARIPLTVHKKKAFDYLHAIRVIRNYDRNSRAGNALEASLIQRFNELKR